MPGQNIPIPDPTLLTTQQLIREIASLREILESRMDGIRNVHEQKFASIQIQFKERDDRVEQAAHDSKMAVDAAFSASKEAVAKSEEGTKDQIKSLDAKVNDIKERFTRYEGRDMGQSITREGTRLNLGTLLAVAVLIIGVISLIASFWKKG